MEGGGGRWPGGGRRWRREGEAAAGSAAAREKPGDWGGRIDGGGTRGRGDEIPGKGERALVRS